MEQTMKQDPDLKHFADEPWNVTEFKAINIRQKHPMERDVIEF